MKKQLLTVFVLVILASLGYFIFAPKTDQATESEQPKPVQIKHPKAKPEPAPEQTPKPKLTTKAAPKEKVDHSNQPLIEKTFPETELQGGLAQHLDDLIQRYENGDLDAGYVLAVNLKRCISAVSSKEALNKAYEDLDKVKTSQFFDEQRRVQAKENRSQEFYYCEGVPKELTSQYFEILQNTAEQGSIAAQTYFVGTITPTFPEKIDHQFTDEELQQLSVIREQYYRFLENAAHQGSFRAMLRVVVTNQPHLDNNPVKSLAYNLAILDLTTNDHTYAGHTEISNRLMAKMTPEQISQARDMSKEIIEIIRQNGTIYRF